MPPPKVIGVPLTGLQAPSANRLISNNDTVTVPHDILDIRRSSTALRFSQHNRARVAVGSKTDFRQPVEAVFQ